jgi:hypothetical protein
MNVLMLGRWLPPPRRPVRTTREYYFARHLARRHRLTVSFITDNPDSAGAISALRNDFGDLEFAEVPRGWKSLAGAVSLVAGESCTLCYFRSEALRLRLADRLRLTRYDLVFVSSSRMIQYALDLDPSIPMVMDFAELDSEWWLRQAARGAFPARRFFRSEAMRLRSAEAAAARRAIRCVVSTPAAARVVRSLEPGAIVSLIPSGVGVDPTGPALPGLGTPTVVFNVPPGAGAEVVEAVEFACRVLSVVRDRLPRTRFVVVSRDPVSNLRPSGVGQGFDVVTLGPGERGGLRGGSVAIAPPGMAGDPRASVLEPMAAGVPVVSTAAVCEQLGLRAGCWAEAAETVPDFAARVVELLENPARREKLAGAAQDFVRATFTWDVAAARLGDVLEMSCPQSTGREGKPRPLPARMDG